MESDHDIGSDFYEGQILARFGEPSRERRLLSAREALTKACLQNRGGSIHQYDEEVLDLIQHIKPPLIWTEEGVTPCIQALNKVATESLNREWLRKQIRADSENFTLRGLGSLKLLEAWIGESLAQPAEAAANLALPFFVLYDLRIAVAHLLPREKVDETLASCKTRLGLDPDSSIPLCTPNVLIWADVS